MTPAEHGRGRRELTLREYRAAMAADSNSSFWAPVRTRPVRSIVLYGTLTGVVWGGYVASLEVHVDLVAEAGRFVNATGSGLVDAVKSAVDDAGDFVSAKLTADSFVMVEHRRHGPPDGTVRSSARRIDVAELPSLAAYVADNVYSADFVGFED